jgi:transcriptional regulator with XRE-family HTH domain
LIIFPDEVTGNIRVQHVKGHLKQIPFLGRRCVPFNFKTGAWFRPEKFFPAYPGLGFQDDAVILFGDKNFVAVKAKLFGQPDCLGTPIGKNFCHPFQNRPFINDTTISIYHFIKKSSEIYSSFMTNYLHKYFLYRIIRRYIGASKMNITELLTDDAVMGELGRRLAQYRVDSQYTQEYLAEKAGIGKRTLERLEKGMQVQTPSLIRVLRTLGLLGGLEILVPRFDVRPMDMLKLKKKRRQRASSIYKIQNPYEGWVWEDEK